MATVIFYEKPGCANNTRQKKLLAASGHTVIARDIVAHPWIEEELASFFEERPVEQWFNRASPRVKSGEIVPEQLSRDEAIRLLLSDHLLIRRPLMEADGRREAGFDQELVDQWLGLTNLLSDPEKCLKSA